MSVRCLIAYVLLICLYFGNNLLVFAITPLPVFYKQSLGTGSYLFACVWKTWPTSILGNAFWGVEEVENMVDWYRLNAWCLTKFAWIRLWSCDFPSVKETSRFNDNCVETSLVPTGAWEDTVCCYHGLELCIVTGVSWYCWEVARWLACLQYFFECISSCNNCCYTGTVLSFPLLVWWVEN